MTEDAVASAILAGVVVAAVVVGAAYQERPHWFGHQWDRWHEVETFMSDTHIVQERECKTCGLKVQRTDSRAFPRAAQ